MEYNKIAQKDVVSKTVAALENKGYQVTVSADKAAALASLKKLLPKGASVQNGASETLEQIGYIDYLKSPDTGLVNMHALIVAETDHAKQLNLRKDASKADYYVGSLHALTEEGDILVASNTGSQMPGIVFNSHNIIFVASTKKIVPDLAEAFNRLNDHVIPLEDLRVQKAYGIPHTSLNQILILKGLSPMFGRTTSVILVEEDLGY